MERCSAGGREFLPPAMLPKSARAPEPGLDRRRRRARAVRPGGRFGYTVAAVERTLFLSGNEALAAGAARAGVMFACAYPGTPSTEIIETLARSGDVAAQWCINEKVAMETAVGASLAGARSLVAMKHVGLNVAADPFMTLSLTGVNAGLVVVTADDPGMHSSQNEQDNRHYARFAKVPLLEPSDSQEAYEFVAHALALSEECDTPVLLRTTTRLSHGRGRVMPRAPIAVSPRVGKGDPQVRHGAAVRARAEPAGAAAPRQAALARGSVSPQRARSGFRRLRDHHVGRRLPVCAGGLPEGLDPQARPVVAAAGPEVAQLYRAVSRVAVVEELDPFIEDQVRALGLPVVGKQALPSNGEFDQEIVFAALEPYVSRRAPAGRRRPLPPPEPVIVPAPTPEEGLPLRPPVLCPGCSHRSVFAALNRHKMVAFGDIGCYTLGALPPLLALDSCLCMGSSIGMMSGMNRCSAARRRSPYLATPRSSTPASRR